MFAIAVAASISLVACWYMLGSCRQTRRELQGQIDTLSAAVQALQQSGAERGLTVDARVAANPQPPAIEPPGGIPSETQEAITTALSAFVGHKVRVRSVKLVDYPDAATTWVTQGRVAVQASHNYRAAGD